MLGRSRRLVVAVVAAATAGIGVYAATAADPADAQTVSYVFEDVQCTATIGTVVLQQTQDVGVDVIAPDEVLPGERFTMTFPGGSAGLPIKGSGLNITSYTNLFQVFEIHGADFDPTSVVNPGTATVQQVGGSLLTVAHEVSFPAANQIKIGQPGPFTPALVYTDPTATATLTVPDVSVEVVAPESGAVTFNAVSLTTRVRLNTTWANVNCTVPTITLMTIPVNPDATTTTGGEETTTTGGDTTTTAEETTTTVEETTTTTEAPTTSTTAPPVTSTLPPTTSTLPPTTSTLPATTTTKPPATTTTTAPVVRLVGSLAASTTEGNSVAKLLRIPIVLDKATKAPIMIAVKSNNNGTADQDVDFEAVDTIVTLAPNQARNTVPVTLIPDTNAEALLSGGFETIKLRATIAPGSAPARFYNGASAITLTGIIVDDDKPFG